MLSICEDRHPGPGCPSGCPGISFEFLIIGGWLSGCDLALESQAHFFAVAEHRLIAVRARNATTQLRRAGISSVWALRVRMFLPGSMPEWELSLLLPLRSFFVWVAQ